MDVYRGTSRGFRPGYSPIGAISSFWTPFWPVLEAHLEGLGGTPPQNPQIPQKGGKNRGVKSAPGLNQRGGGMSLFAPIYGALINELHTSQKGHLPTLDRETTIPSFWPFLGPILAPIEPILAPIEPL